MNGQEERVSWALVAYLRLLGSATPAETANQTAVAGERPVRGDRAGLRALPQGTV